MDADQVPPDAPEVPFKAPGWVARMGQSRFAVPGMALLSLLDACVSPILPEVLLVPLCLAHPERRWAYAVYCSIASVVGAVVGYYIGYGLWENGLREFAYQYIPGFNAAAFDTTSQRFGDNAFLWLLAAAFTPLPFKLFTVAAGVCHDQVSLQVLVLASIAGRLPRFLLEVVVIHRFGPDVVVALRRPAWRIALLLATLGVLVWMIW